MGGRERRGGIRMGIDDERKMEEERRRERERVREVPSRIPMPAAFPPTTHPPTIGLLPP